MTFYFTYPFDWRCQGPMRHMMRHAMAAARSADVESEVFFPVDVKEEEEAFIVIALLPGVKPEDLNIQVAKDQVSIEGKFECDQQGEVAYLLRERPRGKFYRRLSMPSPLDAEKVEAKMEHGILTLRLPKAEEARPKKIKVDGN